MDTTPSDGAMVRFNDYMTGAILRSWGKNITQPGRWFSLHYFAPHLYETAGGVWGMVITNPAMEWEILQCGAMCTNDDAWIKMRGDWENWGWCYMVLRHHVELTDETSHPARQRRGRKHRMRMPVMEAVNAD